MIATRLVDTSSSFPLIAPGFSERHLELLKTLEWKALDTLRRPFERIWGRTFTSLLASAGKKAGRAYQPGHEAQIEEALEIEFAKLPGQYTKLYQQVAEAFGKRADQNVRRLLGKQDVFDESEDALRWIGTQTAVRIAQVSTATKDGVRRIIQRAFVDDLTIDETAKQIEGSFLFGRHRAFRIARTEVVAASNAGTHFSTSRQLPNKRFQKGWLSSRDIRVRDSHIGVDGKFVDMDEAFSLPGGRLMFPGDSSLGAGPEEIVHCRCATSYRPRK